MTTPEIGSLARIGLGIRRLEVLGQPASMLRGVDDDCFGGTDT
jgi:hypothetical protein